MKVSIVITTKNEAVTIERLLQSIKKQTWKNIEIIVVDNHSSDNTVAIAKKYTKKVYQKGPERSAQRNYGAKKSIGDIVFFLDADMILSKDVVHDCVYKFDVNTVQAVVIPEMSIGEGFWSECKIFERSCYLGIDWIESARCYRKNAFLKLRGYDEKLSGPEDFDLPQRLKFIYGASAVARIDSFIFHDEGRLSFTQLIRKKFYYGISMSSYMNKNENKKSFAKQANPLERYLLFFRHYKKMFRSPLVFWGTLVMKTAELGALFLGSLIK